MVKELDIRVTPHVKGELLHIRVGEEIYNQILVLARKHKIPRNAVARSLIEAGLRSIK